MILDTTFIKEEQKQILRDLVGKAFSFVQTIMRRGIISKPMTILDASPNLRPYFHTSNTNYAIIELRSGGILIHINKDEKHYIWAIPYYQMAVNKNNGISIHAQGKYIHFGDQTYLEHQLFFSKLLNEKIKHEFL